MTDKKMKRYIEQFEPVDLGFKILPWFQIDIDRMRAWYADLEKNYGSWKFVLGENKHVWQEEIVDMTGETGHVIPDDAGYYTLCWNSDEEGPKPFEQGQAKPEYRDNDNDELNPRKCFDGYALDVVKSLPLRSKKWVVTVHTPGTRLITHQDAPDKIRIHIPIHIDNTCNWIIDGEEYHMTPGWVYVVNSTLPHSIENAGTGTRVHLYGKVWTDDCKKLFKKDI